MFDVVFILLGAGSAVLAYLMGYRSGYRAGVVKVNRTLYGWHQSLDWEDRLMVTRTIESFLSEQAKSQSVRAYSKN